MNVEICIRVLSVKFWILFQIALIQLFVVGCKPSSTLGTSLSTTAKISLTSKPASAISMASASVSFNASNAVIVECKLDNNNFATCSSPYSVGSLSEGAHEFSVRAKDKTGLYSEVAKANFVVDTLSPNLSFTTVPAASQSSTSAQLSFNVSDSGSGVNTIQCALDNAALVSCTSPMTLLNLSVASHSFKVQATDLAGNQKLITTNFEIVATPPVNTTIPGLTLTSVPNNFINISNASAAFTITNATSSECKLDANNYSACTSPFTASSLSEGSHSLSIRSKNSANIYSPVSVANFIVDTTLPTLSFLSVPATTQTATTAQITFSASDSGSGINAIQCALDAASFSTCTSPVNLANLSVSPHIFKIKATDNAGNSTTATTNFEVTSVNNSGVNPFGFIGNVWPPAFVPISSSRCSSAMTGSHRTYNVGDGKEFADLTNVPWLSLVAGDVVNIYYKATPYKTKFGLVGVGTAMAPIIINGVTDANCNRPEISGQDAITAADSVAMDYASSIQMYGLITIWKKPADPFDTYPTPSFIKIQNLKLTNAKSTNSFKANNGTIQSYDYFSAAIYALRVSDMVVENCDISNNGLGIFTNIRGNSSIDYSANLVIRGNEIYSNGNSGRSTEHNIYSQARRVLVEGNFIGKAFGGSSFKDRSSGLVVRYNRILASARALDLVESEEEFFVNVRTDPLYPFAWVYGNHIVNECVSTPMICAFSPIHWGFDNNNAKARNGTLFFYNNSYLSNISINTMYDFNLFQMGDNDGLQPTDVSKFNIEAFSNIFYNSDSAGMNHLNNGGTILYRGLNYMKTDVATARNGNPGSVSLASGATFLFYTLPSSPNLNAEGAPLVGSSIIDVNSVSTPSFYPAGVNADNLKVQGEFIYPKGAKLRKIDAKMDLGAFEY